MSETLNPGIHKVYFRAWGQTNGRSYLHGDVLKELLESCGITVDSASITAANSTVLYTNFTIPYTTSNSGGETNFQTFEDVIEDLLKSTVGHLSFDNTLTASYYLLAAPSTGLSVSDQVILDSSLEVTYDYFRTYSGIKTSNVHTRKNVDFGESVFESAKAKYLHGIDKIKEINHILESPDRFSVLMSILTERRAKYQFSAKTLTSESEIGDNITLESSKLPASATSKNVKIVDINNNGEQITISAIDLIGI
jgi:hypothetical protein